MASAAQTQDEVTFEAPGVWFHSPLDEEVFFEWFKRIKGYERFYHEGGMSLFLVFRRADLDNTALLDLLAFFKRYEIDMRQLRCCETPRNVDWLRDPEKYWHRAIYGNTGE